jgi:nitrite reductase/ring-hydroxylating ferredoxin subunit
MTIYKRIQQLRYDVYRKLFWEDKKYIFTYEDAIHVVKEVCTHKDLKWMNT